MSSIYEFQKPEVANALEHLEALNCANESVLIGKPDSIMLSERAIRAFHFFDVTLVSQFGVQGAAGFLETLEDSEPKSKLIDYYLKESDLKNICINEAHLKYGGTVLNSGCDGNNDISKSCVIDFKPEQGIENFDVSFKIMNKRNYARPFVPIVVEAEFDLIFGHLSLKKCTNDPIRKLFYTSLDDNEVQTVSLFNFINCRSLSRNNIKISNIRFVVSVPKFRTFSPISNRQSSRKMPVLSNLKAA